jgi:hypothetical protein
VLELRTLICVLVNECRRHSQARGILISCGKVNANQNVRVDGQRTEKPSERRRGAAALPVGHYDP